LGEYASCEKVKKALCDWACSACAETLQLWVKKEGVAAVLAGTADCGEDMKTAISDVLTAISELEQA